MIVLCNLKDRNLVGFKSQGMVICSSNADHSVVKLLDPPAGAQPGDGVSFPGFGLEEEVRTMCRVCVINAFYFVLCVVTNML